MTKLEEIVERAVADTPMRTMKYRSDATSYGRAIGRSVARAVVEELLPWAQCRFCDMGAKHDCALDEFRALAAPSAGKEE